MKIESKSKIVMIGDSITDCGRFQPDGEGNLGDGYVFYVQTLLNACYPERLFRVINKGTGGHTTVHLRNRWEEDVINLKPNWITLMIGANDVWRHFDCPHAPELAVNIEDYEKNIIYMIEKSQKELNLDGFILLTPYFIEPNKDDKMRQMMDNYGNVVKKIGAKFNFPVIDTQKIFDDVLKVKYSWGVSGDRIHPNNAGHMLIARAVLKEVGFDFYHGA